MFRFLKVAVTNYHRHGGLKQKFILSQFWTCHDLLFYFKVYFIEV